jgi:hypothetical protein
LKRDGEGQRLNVCNIDRLGDAINTLLFTTETKQKEREKREEKERDERKRQSTC